MIRSALAIAVVLGFAAAVPSHAALAADTAEAAAVNAAENALEALFQVTALAP